MQRQRKQLPPYTCIRCGYETKYKKDMNRHLYMKKTDCHSIVNVIVLTEDIKRDILKNRIHHIIDPNKIQNQTINNYTVINNFIANQDTMKKLTHYVDYKDIEPIDFESKVENTYEDNVRMLENDEYKGGFQLKSHDLYDIANQLTKPQSIENDSFFESLNIFLDNHKNRIMVYEGDREKWKEHMLEPGMSYLVDKMAGSYLEAYECYLIRKILFFESRSRFIDQTTYMQCIIDYYRFIASFDVEPYVKGKYDNQVLYNREDDEYDKVPKKSDDTAFEIVRRFQKMYNKIKEDTKPEQKQNRKMMVDILKANSKECMKELNRKVVELFHMDQQFKDQFMIKYQ